MRLDVQIVIAQPEHVPVLAPKLRSEHLQEIAAFSWVTPAECLLDNLEHSSGAFTVLEDGSPIGMFGVVPSEDDSAAFAWLMGSDRLRNHPKAMVTVGRKAVREWLASYPVLHSFVDQRYACALRWAHVIGFTLGEPQPLGVCGEMFVPVEARA